MPMEVVALVTVLLLFGGLPLTAMWTSHRQKMRKLELQMGGKGDDSVRAAMETLRQEVRALRDLTTQYDISFDAALHRLEERVENVELRSLSPQSRERYATSNTVEEGRAVELQSGR